MKKTFALFAAAVVSACSGSSRDSTTSPAAPIAPNPGEPNETLATATPLTPGTPVVATISSGTDLDSYKFTVPSGGATVHFQTFDQGGTACDPAHAGVDPVVEVLDASGTSLWYEDDSPSVPTAQPYCEDFTVHLDAGTNYVVVSGWEPFPFVYTLKVDVL
jgi:hypothetical protein